MDSNAPLSTRSVILSLLLGIEEGSLPVGVMVRVLGPMGFSAAPIRTALSRMVTAGDLEAAGGGVYRLGKQHRIRQNVQDERIHPVTKPEDGAWAMAVVVVSGRDAARRAHTRQTLTAARYAELREGVWMRPDNLATPLPPLLDIEKFTLVPDDESTVVTRLWDLDVWAHEADLISEKLRNFDDPAAQFAAAAAAVRLLQTDPVLPDRLKPAGWPADTLRELYVSYRTYIAQLTNTEV